MMTQAPGGHITGWRRRLAEGTREILGRDLGADEAGQFGKYLELLLKWQRVHRLVGSGRAEWIVSHLFLDSLLFRLLLPCPAATVLDFGSGAGFPGVPIRIVDPGVHVTLLEARARRVSFLRAVVRELTLSNVTIVAARGEDLDPAVFGAKFDAVVARCAGERHGVIQTVFPLVRPGGRIIISGKPEDSALHTTDMPAGDVEVLSRAVCEPSDRVRGGSSPQVTTVPGPLGLRTFVVVSKGP